MVVPCPDLRRPLMPLVGDFNLMVGFGLAVSDGSVDGNADVGSAEGVG